MICVSSMASTIIMEWDNYPLKIFCLVNHVWTDKDSTKVAVNKRNFITVVCTNGDVYCGKLDYSDKSSVWLGFFQSCSVLPHQYITNG